MGVIGRAPPVKAILHPPSRPEYGLVQVIKLGAIPRLQLIYP